MILRIDIVRRIGDDCYNLIGSTITDQAMIRVPRQTLLSMPNNIMGASSPSSTNAPTTDDYQLAKFAAVGGFMFFMFVPAEEDPREYVPLADWLCYLPPYHGDPAYHYQEDHQ